MLKKPKAIESNLDHIIENLEQIIITADEESDMYATHLANLSTLYELRDGSPASKKKTELKDWIPVIGSAGGILIIVVFEAFGHTVTSKGVGFVTKLKG